MRVQRATMLGSIAVGGACLLTAALAMTSIADDCENYTHGCYESVPVPCSNAVCVSIASFPEPVDPPEDANCPGGAPIARYSATTAPGWNKGKLNNAMQGMSYVYPYCGNNQNAICANVNFFSGAPCALNTTFCETGFISGCGANSGSPCQ